MTVAGLAKGVLAATFSGLFITGAQAAEAALGEKVFIQRCGLCHEAVTEKNKVGPSLKGLFGRAAGSVAGFAYSGAMKASGVTWSEETLKAFLTNPKDFVPNNKMAFNGVKREGEMENLIEYFKELAK